MTPREQGFVTDEYADEMVGVHTDLTEYAASQPPQVLMNILVQMHDQMCRLIARIQKLEENKE